jgi:hypothetical protein
MDFKDIVLAILDKRRHITCPEKNLFCDFDAADCMNDSFLKWCEDNRIIYKRFPRKHLIKLSKVMY